MFMSFYDFDLTARYHLSDNVDLFGSVKNVFDTKPPLDVIDYAGANYNPTFASVRNCWSVLLDRCFVQGLIARRSLGAEKIAPGPSPNIGTQFGIHNGGLRPAVFLCPDQHE